MKKMILALGMFIAQMSFAQIKYEQAVTMNPLIFTVTGAYCNSYRCNFTDSTGITRLNLEFGQSYTLRNSANEIINTVAASDELLKQTGRILSRSSSSCPGKIMIDRNTIKIFDVRSACSVAGVETMVLTSKYSSTYYTNLSDSSSSVRLVYDPSTSRYMIKFGTGLDSSRSVPTAETTKFESYIKSVRSACPLTIEFNNQTGEILKMKMGCDPLALVESEEQNG